MQGDYSGKSTAVKYQTGCEPPDKSLPHHKRRIMKQKIGAFGTLFYEMEKGERPKGVSYRLVVGEPRKKGNDSTQVAPNGFHKKSDPDYRGGGDDGGAWGT